MNDYHQRFREKWETFCAPIKYKVSGLDENGERILAFIDEIWVEAYEKGLNDAINYEILPEVQGDETI